MTKHISILGSTGSIGTQALEVISAHPGKFIIDVLAAGNNAALLIEQAKKFIPSCVVIGNEEKYTTVKEALKSQSIDVFAGKKDLCESMKMSSTDMVLAAMVGFAGLEPTLSAIMEGKNIALANKETLVVAGELVMQMAKKHKVRILPVDSEHSAIYQCLCGEAAHSVEKIYLTASGGPFRNKSLEYMRTVTRQQALCHPTWSMGNKVTIDSASLMNKGLEAIEARWLFDLTPSQIEVIIHPQSIIHSVVQFVDGSMKAQMGLPDMRLPIQYALSYPKRLATAFPRFNFLQYPQLTFEKPDSNKFPNLALAFQAMNSCGNMPCVLNAANEIAVDAFLHEKIRFTQMPEIIEKTMERVPFLQKNDFACLLDTDVQARKIASEIIMQLHK